LSCRRFYRNGFTIIELLVAVGVTALLVSLMLTIVVNVMSGWNRSSGSLTSGNQARTVLDIISRDLQSAIMKRNGDVWLAATIQTSGTGFAWDESSKPTTVDIPAIPASGDSLPSLEDDYKFGQAGVWLRFFSSIPGSNAGTDISAPRAISYQIIRRSVSGTSKEQSYMLHRASVSPQDTFTNGYDLYNTNGVYYTGDIRNPGVDSVIANNVVDFGVRCFKRNTATGVLELIYPDTGKLSFAATSTTGKTGSIAGENTPVVEFPDVIEVSVRILTDEGVQQIANLEDPNLSIGGIWWDIALANSHVYTRRIEIKARSL
jgi:prepilin-type N-terminal cleavage/methylation domain-containing protein